MTPKNNRWRTALWVITLILALAALGTALWTMQQVASRPHLPDWILIEEGPVAHGFDKFYRNAYFKGNIETAGDLDVAGDTTLTGTLTLSEAAGTITTTQMLTPTAAFYQVEPAEEITITLAACSLQGQPVIIYNDVTTATNIAATNLLPASGIALGQHDIFVGLCDGADWVLMLNQNN